MSDTRAVRVIFAGNAKGSLESLNKIVGGQRAKGKTNSEEIQLLNSIMQKTELLKQNPQLGDNVPKRLIPKGWDVDNLWRIELSQFWRMLYTLRGDRIEIICFILELVDHKTYNKIFGYKNK